MKKLEKLIDEYGGDLKDKLRKEPIFFIEEIMDFPLNKYQREWIDLIHNNKRINITAFRSSGKTEVCFILYSIWKAFTESGWQGIIISDSLNQSTSVLRRIKDKIRENEVLRTAIPDDKSKSWSKSEIELKNGSRITCRPYSPKIRGVHVDWVGCDEAGEYKDKDIFQSAITPIVTAKDGTIVVVGTPTSKMDLLHDLRDNKTYVSRIYPANKEYEDKTLWKIRYPDTSLEEKKNEMNSQIAFSREYLCTPMSKGDSLFPYDTIEIAYDYQEQFLDKPRDSNTYYFGLDFAMSGKSGADYSAFAVLEKNDKDQIRLVRMERYKGMPMRKQIKRIEELYDVFKPVRILADEGSFGKTFIQELRDKHLPVVGFNFQNRRVELLETLRGAFEINFNEGEPKPFKDRKFFISANKKDNFTNTVIELLTKELTSFAVVFKQPTSGDLTGKVNFESVKSHNDTVMALALAYFTAREGGGGNYTIRRSSGQGNSRSLIQSTR